MSSSSANGNSTEMELNYPSMLIEHPITASQRHFARIDDQATPSPSSNQSRPAPGKALRSKSSKKLLDKHSEVYKRERQKSRSRELDIKKRQKELEEENTQLQAQITELAKEYNALHLQLCASLYNSRKNHA